MISSHALLKRSLLEGGDHGQHVREEHHEQGEDAEDNGGLGHKADYQQAPQSYLPPADDYFPDESLENYASEAQDKGQELSNPGNKKEDQHDKTALNENETSTFENDIEIEHTLETDNDRASSENIKEILPSSPEEENEANESNHALSEDNLSSILGESVAIEVVNDNK